MGDECRNPPGGPHCAGIEQTRAIHRHRPTVGQPAGTQEPGSVTNCKPSRIGIRETASINTVRPVGHSVAHVGPRREGLAQLANDATNEKTPRRAASWATGLAPGSTGLGGGEMAAFGFAEPGVFSLLVDLAKDRGI